VRARAAWPERPTRVTRACAPGSFWAVFMLNHLLIAFVLCSPCDVYGVLLGVVLMGYFWNCTCSPPAYDKASPSQTQGNINVFGYYCGALVLYRNIPGGLGSARAGCLVGLVMLDCVMGLGHTWDRQATMETVTNCRLFYVCALSLALCGVYGLWNDTLRVP
jgi:hypothetical protein